MPARHHSPLPCSWHKNDPTDFNNRRLHSCPLSLPVGIASWYTVMANLCLSCCLSCLSVMLSVLSLKAFMLSISLGVFLSFCYVSVMPLCLSACWSVCMSVCLSVSAVCLSVFLRLSVCMISVNKPFRTLGIDVPVSKVTEDKQTFKIQFS